MYNILMSLIYIGLSYTIGNITSLFIGGGVATLLFGLIVFFAFDKIETIKIDVKYVFIVLFFIVLLVSKDLLQNLKMDVLCDAFVSESKEKFADLIAYVNGLSGLFYYWVIFCTLFYFKRNLKGAIE
jgi:preprotein translocase subunit Sec61beta